MTKLRTKEQIAFDGIKVSWQKDPFTDILNYQTRMKFSIDGVVPPNIAVRSLNNTKSSTVLIKRKYKDVLSGKINGISFPWGRRYAA